MDESALSPEAGGRKIGGRIRKLGRCCFGRNSLAGFPPSSRVIRAHGRQAADISLRRVRRYDGGVAADGALCAFSSTFSVRRMPLKSPPPHAVEHHELLAQFQFLVKFCVFLVAVLVRKGRTCPEKIPLIKYSFYRPTVCVTFASRQIVRCDEKEVVKLRHQLEITREELMESGKALGNSKAIVETYRAKAETASSEFSEINNMLLRVSEPLRNILSHTFRESYESSVGIPREFSKWIDYWETRRRARLILVASSRISALASQILP